MPSLFWEHNNIIWKSKFLSALKLATLSCSRVCSSFCDFGFLYEFRPSSLICPKRFRYCWIRSEETSCLFFRVYDIVYILGGNRSIVPQTQICHGEEVEIVLSRPCTSRTSFETKNHFWGDSVVNPNLHAVVELYTYMFILKFDPKYLFFFCILIICIIITSNDFQHNISL